jgi:thiol:disulfide interchange protein DsbD
MDLERDEFVIKYDASLASEMDLIAAGKKAGFPSRVVSDPPTIQPDPPFFSEAVSQAARERKPLVLDFTANWCVPCQRMLKETFPDPKVAPLLDQCVLIKIDTDQHPALSQKFGVVGLPDIRLLTPDGEEIRRLRDFQNPDAFASELETLLATASFSSDTDANLVVLSNGEQQLRDAFNEDRGAVRLVVILSPT